MHLAEIAHCARDVDFAIRWGFGWKLGPFELWQAAGWQQVAGWIAEDIAAGKTMAKAPLPGWVTDGRKGVHGPQGSFSAADDTMHSRSTLPVYARQLFPELVLGEKPADRGTTVFEDEGVRLWHQGDGIAIVSIKSKMHSLGSEVLAGLNRALDEAEANYDALVIWHEAPFAVGANLKAALGVAQGREVRRVRAMVALFQQTSQRLKYSLVPTVAAVEGMALGRRLRVRDAFAARGGGARELRRPGRGGRGPAARRRRPQGARPARQRVGQGRRRVPGARAPLPAGGDGGRVQSAEHARELGYLQARRRGGVPPGRAPPRREGSRRAPWPSRATARRSRPTRIPVAGSTGIATLKMMLVNMKEGGFISDHDYEIGSRIATVICGGEVEPGSLVDEKWLLDLERHHFLELAKTEKTQARIEHMLKTGKPLRN